MKFMLPVSLGLVSLFLVALMIQPVASEEPRYSFKSFVSDFTCGPVDGDVVIVYDGYRFQPAPKKDAGCICKAGSECVSGSCSCKLGINPVKSRCCHEVSGQSCTTNDECQSGKCTAGKCEKVECKGTEMCDSRPDGSSCRVNDDCQSGKCRLQGDGTYECEA